MIQDDKKYKRELGLRRILKARQINAKRKTIRVFKSIRFRTLFFFLK
jgi:hypothetical protein